MKNKFWTSEKLLSMSALFVSLFTLGVFIYQTDLIREQQYMSVYPHLALTNYRSGSLEYEYILMNNGVGPALIKSVSVEELNGKSYNSINEYLNTRLNINDSIWVYNSDIYEGRLIPANEKIVLFGLFNEEQTNALNLPKNSMLGAKKLRQILNNDSLIVKITYESIYGEKWSIFKESRTPVKE